MLALIYDEESRCPCGCGQYVDQAQSRDFNWDVTAVKCYAGQALDIVRRMESKSNKGAEGWDDGLLWTVTPVPVVPTESRH